VPADPRTLSKPGLDSLGRQRLDLLLRLQRLCLLLSQFLLLLLREVMSHGTADDGAGNRVMSRYMPRHSADRRTFDTTLRRGGLGADQENER
jgi:hypothetical protein